MEHARAVFKKIGNVAALCMITSFTLLAAEATVVLVIKDMNGDTLEQAAAGVPFVAEVIIQGLEGSVDNVTIQGAEKFSVARQGVTQQVQTINGVTTRKMIYRFAIRIDSSGTYQLGPVLVTHSGRDYASAPVRVQVGKKKAFKEQPTAEIRLSIDKDLLVPGEATIFRVRFYADEQVSISRMGMPEFGALHAGELEGPVSGYDTSHGNNRYFLEWRTQLYADEPGSYRIPAIVAEYRSPRKHGTSLLDDDFFAGLFSRASQLQQETSNSLEITINNLPPTNKQVAGVGVFSSVSLACDRDTLPVGEAAVLTLEVIGSHNLERLQSPPLIIPEQLKYYESKNYVHEQKTFDGQKKKTFEYIVQGVHEGTVTIPSQMITFFNLATRSYTTLATKPISITITPPVTPSVATPSVFAKASSDKSPDKSPDRSPDKSSDRSSDGAPDGAPDHELLDGPLYASRDRQMSWWLFILLCMLPFGLLLGYGLYAFVRSYAHIHTPYATRTFAYMRAQSAIKRACKTQQYGQLYTIFKQFLSDRTGNPYITEESMLRLVRDAGAPDVEVYAFETFIQKLASISFASSAAHVRDGAALQKESETWLKWLRKLV
jgi:hypothetical protein